ncbi:MAG: hypothetical protein LC623_01125 [Halobacteriales archaeon]|nr:hypothetical protein [Halobacteriales archaeon]
MRARVRGWVALAFALLFLPTAQADATLSLRASGLDLHGPADVTAALYGALFQDDACPTLSVNGTADHIHVDLDRNMAPYVVANPVPGSENGTAPLPSLKGINEGKQDSQSLDFDDARIQVTQAQPGCRLVAWAEAGEEAGIGLPRGPASLRAAGKEDAISHSGHASDRSISLDPADRLLVSAAGAGAATLAGALHLSVWMATLDIQSPRGSFHAVLGQEMRDAEPPAGAPPTQFIKSQTDSEAFLRLEGTSLDLSRPPASLLAFRAHFDNPDGSADLKDAVILSSGAPSLASTPLKGPRGDAQARDDLLEATLTGGELTLNNGHTVALGGSFPLWPLWTGGLLLVTALGARRGALLGMRRAADQDACERAALLAGLVWPANAESRTTRVVCLLRLGRLETAGRALQPRRWRRHQATRSFLQARLDASRGDLDAARRHLTDCFLLAPAFVADARADLALHGIVEGALLRLHQLQASSREGYA